MIDSSTDLEVLEQLWEEEHCADAHRFPENRNCSHVPVSHLTTRCGHLTDSPRCAPSTANHRAWMAGDRVTCAGCGQLAAECWILTE